MDGWNGKTIMTLFYQFTCTIPNSSDIAVNEQFILLILYILFFILFIYQGKIDFKRDGFLKLASFFYA